MLLQRRRHIAQDHVGVQRSAYGSLKPCSCLQLTFAPATHPALPRATLLALPQKGVQAGGVLGVGLVAPIVLAVHKYQASNGQRSALCTAFLVMPMQPGCSSQLLLCRREQASG